MFGALDIAMSGATFSRTWMDAISDNVANVSTVNGPGEEPFRARMVVAEAVRLDGERGGVRAAGIVLREPPFQLVYDPTNPLADEEGFVTPPLVDLGQEMTNLVLASRSYQANLSVVDRVRDAYQAALRIGQS